MPIPGWARGVFAFLLGFTLMLGIGRCTAQAASILPNGVSCFQQASGPLSSGSIYMLVPNTTTPKDTWQDSGQTILNTNPIQLDASGCAIIYGAGTYRQQIYTGPVVSGAVTGTLLYDVVTSSAGGGGGSGGSSVFWAGTAGGTANAITVTDADFGNVDGSVINFLALNTNTGSTTLSVSSGTPVPIEVPSGSGPIAITAGCITANNDVSVVYSSTANAFLLLTACTSVAGGVAGAPSVIPGGYLTLSSDTNNVVVATDTSGAANVYYTPYTGNLIPLWNGTAFVTFSFSQLTLALNASQHLANTIYDACVFSNNGTLVLVTGPAWSSSAAGTSTRGTGAGSTQLLRLDGIWVNAVQITGTNGMNTYTVPADQCTYVGSIFIDNTAGQMSDYVSYGQAPSANHGRGWATWNAYHRNPISIQMGDPTASWTYNTAAWRQSNGATVNFITSFTGLNEEPVACNMLQRLSTNGQVLNDDVQSEIGIGTNWTTGTPGGTLGYFHNGNGGTNTREDNTTTAKTTQAPVFGVTTFTSVENNLAGPAGAFFGTQSFMVTQCDWRG